MVKASRKSTSFSLSDQARELLEKIAAHKGLNKTGTLELILREEARKIGLE